MVGLEKSSVIMWKFTKSKKRCKMTMARKSWMTKTNILRRSINSH